MFWVTAIGVFVVAAGTGVSAYMAFLTQEQVRAAVGQLRAAEGQLRATQTQVELANRQLLDAESDSQRSEARQEALLQANRKVAAAAEAQAEATRQSSSAALLAAQASVQAANAEQRAALATEAAHKPAVAVRSVTIRDLSGKPDSDGRVLWSARVRFANTGGSTVQLTDIEAVPVLAASLPTKPDYSSAALMRAGGNDLAIPPGNTDFGPESDWKLLSQKAVAEGAVSRGYILMYGIVRYTDVGGMPHRQCFAVRVNLNADGADRGYFSSTGGPAYQCAD